MPELQEVLSQLVAGQQETMKLLQSLVAKRKPDEDFALPGQEDDDDEKMAEGAAPVAASAPVQVPTSQVTDAKPEEGTKDEPSLSPKQATITVKHSEEKPDWIKELERKVQVLERANTLKDRALKFAEEKVEVQKQIETFTLPGNMRFPPALASQVEAMALSLSGNGKTIKFSDAKGEEHTGTPRGQFYKFLQQLPELTDRTKRQARTIQRKPGLPTDNVAAFSESVKADAKARGITEKQAWEDAAADLSVEEYGRLAGVFGPDEI